MKKIKNTLLITVILTGFGFSSQYTNYLQLNHPNTFIYQIELVKKNDNKKKAKNFFSIVATMAGGFATGWIATKKITKK